MKRRICEFIDCINGLDYTATGYCRTHHKQFISGQELKPIKKRGSGRSICLVQNCGRFVEKESLCRPHYKQKEKGLNFNMVRKVAKPGSGCIDSNGYRQITINGLHTYEHRYIMSQHLGRELLTSETVHHINGNRIDNRVENLELWSTHQPTGQRVIDKIKWAKEILSQYENELHLFTTKLDDKNNK